MKSLFSIIIFFGLLFNSILENFIPFFSFFDEVIFILIIFQNIFLGILKNKTDNIYVFIILFSFLVIISTFNSYYFRGMFLSFLDLFLFFKVFLLIPFFIQLTSIENNYILNIIAKFSSQLIFLAAIFLVSFLIYNFPKSEFVRFGINSYHFFSHNPGEFGNQVLVMTIFVMISKINITKKKIIFLLSIILLLSTLRFKFFAFSFLLLFLYKPLIYNSFQPWKKQSFSPLNFKNILIFIGIFFIVSSPFEEYFLDDQEMTGPRLRFVQDSIEFTKNNFPIGIGPGTFGSPIANLYYSPVYLDLGYNDFYGMSEDESLFLNDNFWPTVLVQYGFILCLLYIFFIYKISFNFFTKVKFYKTESLIAFFSLISSTIGSSIFTGPIGASYIIFLLLIFNYNRGMNFKHE